MRRGTVMLSGGIDSVVLAYWAKQQGLDLQFLFFDYGQDALRGELYSSRKTSQRLDVPLEVFDISGLRHNFIGLTGHDYRMITVQPAAEPNSACADLGLGLGIAAEYSIITNRELVLVGNIKNDTIARPRLADFFVSFTQSINYLYEGSRPPHKISVEAPFLDKGKREIVDIGRSLGVDFSLSWSCQRSGTTPCRDCPGCRERAEAFTDAGIKDPLG